jgi:hypothetical protein
VVCLQRGRRFEQSPDGCGTDKVILSDLVADYARQIVDNTILNWPAADTHRILDRFKAASTIAHTDAIPRLYMGAALYAKTGRRSSKSRPPDSLPDGHQGDAPERRWAWCAVQVDTAGRAVILPLTPTPFR